MYTKGDENKVLMFKINEDFKNVMPPINELEYRQLETSIIDNGFLNSCPIVTWEEFIVDGHNRYEICKKHNIKFSHIVLDTNVYKTNSDVIKYIIDTHLNRRNLTSAQKISIVYKYKDIIEYKAKMNMKIGGKGDQIEGSINTRKELAKMAGVGESTLRNFEVVIKSGNKSLIQQMMSGEESIYGVYKKINTRKPIPSTITKIKTQVTGGRCEICGCGIVPILELHHVEMICNGGDNRYENLKLLCPNCHSIIHILEKLKDDTARQEVVDSLKDTSYIKIIDYINSN